MKRKPKSLHLLSIPLAMSLAANCFAETRDLQTLFDFNGKTMPPAFSFSHTDAELMPQADNNRALGITLLTKAHKEASIEIQPKTPWDWSKYQDFGVALDVRNPSDESLQLYATVSDGKGQTHNRSVSIPANSLNTYYIELHGVDLDRDTGLRGNPQSWTSDDIGMIWRWGVKKLDLSQITGVAFSASAQPRDRRIIIDDVRLLSAPKKNDDYLDNLLDEFGQNAKLDYTDKVKDEAHLRKLAKEEAATLRTTPLEGRSKFGGWKQGPKLKATGYFRTEKHDGKWALVDPEGYLFFSHGLANVRMANTSTITGYDFDHSKIKARAADDLTPEDSVGLNRVNDEALPTRKQVSALRANLFNWLPEYQDKLSKHFGYRREVHSGPLERGETFSFYQANLERKFGIADTEKMHQRWRENTVDRMLTWGFTSFGNWVDPGYYQMNRFPYFANGWIIGDFKTVSTGNDYWSPLPDPFDPLFTERTQKTVAQIAKEVQGNPWCIGVFIDNEKSWGNMGSLESQYAIVLNTLGRSAADSPTKNEFSKIAKKRYSSIKALNKAWKTQIKSWDEFDAGIKLEDLNSGVVKDLSFMLEHYASEYFRIVSKTVKDAMPNHMYMGARFADWGMTPEVRAAAAKYSDVMSYNFYEQSIHPEFWSFLEEIDKPSIIGEFHMGSSDTGFFNPGLVLATDQKDRARMYSEYMDGVLENPYFIGAHWFQYIDSPISGRAFDGENYNIGFVSIADVPYAPMIKAAKAFNSNIYTRRFGEDKE